MFVAAVRTPSVVRATLPPSCRAYRFPVTVAAAMLQRRAYHPPAWASDLKAPAERLQLAHLPTPIHRWSPPGFPEGTRMWIKRDDLTGLEVSGNKIRKLEFLLAEAQREGATTVVTIGGVQSNHCRSTCAAARMLGMHSALILRVSGRDTEVEDDPGLTGNLMLSRMMGASLHLVSREAYQTHGSDALVAKLTAELRAAGAAVYSIPVGGSNELGTWGYLEMVRELEAQQEAVLGPGRAFDAFATACGSGGTAAGLSLGVSRSDTLAGPVYAAAVCDSEAYFYDFIDGLFRDLGASEAARDTVTLLNARGRGYALNTAEELAYIRDVALQTGVVLDPVYSGKALHALQQAAAADPAAFVGKDVLFLHTGGTLGLYDKAGELLPMVQAVSPCAPLELP